MTYINFFSKLIIYNPNYRIKNIIM